LIFVTPFGTALGAPGSFHEALTSSPEGEFGA
jgi:hypothetical protein